MAVLVSHVVALVAKAPLELSGGVAFGWLEVFPNTYLEYLAKVGLALGALDFPNDIMVFTNLVLVPTS